MLWPPRTGGVEGIARFERVAHPSSCASASGVTVPMATTSPPAAAASRSVHRALGAQLAVGKLRTSPARRSPGSSPQRLAI